MISETARVEYMTLNINHENHGECVIAIAKLDTRGSALRYLFS
jgi:hypothetical protein